MGKESGEPGPRRVHPRYGYVVEVWLGAAENYLILVEIHETYNVWAQEKSKGYHYKPYDLLDGKQMEIKTVGSMSLGRMRAFAKRHTTIEGMEWVKLRGWCEECNENPCHCTVRH